MIDVQFSVPMEPKAYTRAQLGRGANGKPRHFKAAKDRNFQAAVALSAAPIMPAIQIAEPVRVDILAVFRRPERLRRPKSPKGMVWCPKKPDADNIEKNILDSLKSLLFDDKVVCAGEVV